MGRDCSQKEKSADKFASHGDEMVSRAIWDPHEEGRRSWALHFLVLTFGCYSVGFRFASASVAKDARQKAGVGLNIVHGGLRLPLLSHTEGVHEEGGGEEGGARIEAELAGRSTTASTPIHGIQRQTS